jgi:hypothetical protein
MSVAPVFSVQTEEIPNDRSEEYSGSSALRVTLAWLEGKAMRRPKQWAASFVHWSIIDGTPMIRIIRFML